MPVYGQLTVYTYFLYYVGRIYIELLYLPDRVFGNPGAFCIKSGVAIGPIFSRTVKNKI